MHNILINTYIHKYIILEILHPSGFVYASNDAINRPDRSIDLPTRKLTDDAIMKL